MKRSSAFLVKLKRNAIGFARHLGINMTNINMLYLNTNRDIIHESNKQVGREGRVIREVYICWHPSYMRLRCGMTLPKRT